MKRKQILFSVLLLFSVVATQAARVDTIMVKSPSMSKEVQVVCVLPDKALGEKAEACRSFICCMVMVAMHVPG